MGLTKIDAELLKKMFLNGAKSIEKNKEYINELNVFPVPDGDTGTNMTLTIMAAAKEVSQIENLTLGTLAKAIASGSLRGARGNSGVILSQLFRGFAKEIADYNEINVRIMTSALTKAADTAYKAVMKPKEGTILTVARGGAERAAQLMNETEDMVYFLDEVISHMEHVLEQTPELLPVLKEAGVVDSGGQGLVVILKGAWNALTGKEEIDTEEILPVMGEQPKPYVQITNISTADIKFGYCTEFLITLEKEQEGIEQELLQYYESIGDSIVVVADDEIVKVHVHTNDPGLAIQKALTFGQLGRIKIDNMREEHQEKLVSEEEKRAAAAKTVKKQAKKEVGFISISAGTGFYEVFKGMGADYIIEGGQTMNPSTEDMLNAIDAVNADTIFIFPNNSNIILTAQQAQKMTKDKKIFVIPTKTIPQGITALINYIFDKPYEENENRMVEAMRSVKTGQITYAVRDTSIDGKEIKQGDIMGLDDKTIVCTGHDVTETAFQLINDMVKEQDEIISIYYGKDVEKEEAEALSERISDLYPAMDVELIGGGQPIYYYIISVE